MGKKSAFSFEKAFHMPNDDSDDDEEDIEEEKTQLAQNADKQKKDIEHLEQLVCQSPHSSIIWIKYMAYYLEGAEIEKARAVADRALRKIVIREEQERLNIWVAYMNLENNSGTEMSLDLLVKRALQSCDPMKINMHLIDIYMNEKNYLKAEEVYKKIYKRFKSQTDYWIGYGLCYFIQEKFDAAREIMQRSLKSLPQTEHIGILRKFAKMEFTYGDKYIGHTMFENILSSYPKRHDIWFQYIDLMTKHETSLVRDIFQRAIAKKFRYNIMKLLFQKYLAFETQHGTKKSMEEVKQKALKYVTQSRGNRS